MPWWFTALIFVGSFIASELLRPKPQIENARPKDLGEFDFPTATEGRKIPLVWGTVQLKGPNVIWYGDLEARAIKEKIKTGIFSSETIIKGYNYLVGMQMALCRGPVDAITRIWIGDKLLTANRFDAEGEALALDFPDFFGGDDVGGNGGIVGTVRAYLGTETQAANSYLSAFQSPQPAYRGTAYVVYEKGTIGNSTSIKPWKFEVERIANPLGLTGGDENIAGGMNPANVLYEILTNDEWGLNLPGTDIDTANFVSIADTLATEGNGFSFVLDSQRDIVDIIREVERQIDGFLFFNRSTALWQINLARGGYTIGSLPLADNSNVLEIRDWSRGSWDDTINQVNIEFSYFDASLSDWKTTSARAQDIANFGIQGGLYTPADENFPGVKTAALANQIAWRELRGRSRPLAHGTLVVNRDFYDVNPGDVLRLTYGDDLNYTDLPIRVNKVDLGELVSGKITLQVSEDAFSFEAGSYGNPGNSGWVPPADTLVAIPTDEDIVMEAPRAIALRDPSNPGVFDRIYVGAVHQGDGATSFRAWTRHAAGTPSGAYTEDVEVFDFIKLGTLNVTLPQNTANPTTLATEDIRVDPVTNIDEILAEVLASASVGDLGQDLANLFLIEDEFLLVTNVVDQTTYIDLQVAYRGALDSVAREHASGANVFLVIGNIGRLIYPRGNNVDVKLRTRSTLDELSEGGANTIQITLADRGRAPYPPQDLNIEAARYPAGPISLDNTTASGSGLDQVGFDVSWTRRDFETYDEVDNVNGIVGSGFPGGNNTRHRVSVVDVSGAPAALFSTPFAQKASDVVTRTEILAHTDGVVPTDLQVLVNTRHDYDATITDVDALQDEQWEFPVTSAALSGLDNTGARAQNVVSASFTADVTATYTFEIGTDLLTSGALEVELNDGGFVTVISSGGGTSGTISITAGDKVEWRHTQAGSGTSYTHLRIHHGGTNEAYGVLIV
jgi:hypothetical protein